MYNSMGQAPPTSSHVEELIKSKPPEKSRFSKLYNQNAAPQDSEKTCFYYHKVLAYELMTAVFSVISIGLSTLSYMQLESIMSDSRAKSMISYFTVYTMISVGFENHSRFKWQEEKKDINANDFTAYFWLFVELLLILPCPNNFIGGTLAIHDVKGNPVQIPIDNLLMVYQMFRLIYVVKFYIHSELFYGSRPDRLSRLYTVKFGTFKAFTFLINEKPMAIVTLMGCINLAFIPFLLLLIEGKKDKKGKGFYKTVNKAPLNNPISSPTFKQKQLLGSVNPAMATFEDCLHFSIVSQVTLGYGDSNVITIFGRLIAIFCILIGVSSTSLLLIFFMKVMECSPQQEQVHMLLNLLRKKQLFEKVLVARIESEMIVHLSRKTPEREQQEMKKLKEFRFQNRQAMTFHREKSTNIKRMMLRNFKMLIDELNLCKKQQILLVKYLELFQNVTKEEQKIAEKDKSNFERKKSQDIIRKIMLGNIN